MSRPRTFRPRVECLENRLVPSTFTVTNLLDDGSAGSLRGAIAKANDLVHHPGLDTVLFQPGLEGTIRLNGTEIAITDNLTLRGPGAAKVAISGHFSSRIFNIDGGAAAADLNITIQGLELSHGQTTGDGGAILCKENLKLVQTVFTQNRANNGGAIECVGDLLVKKSTIAGNTTSGNDARYGGGIHCNMVTIRGSTISGNTASVSGGGLSCGTATITGSTISGNTASNFGGGLVCDTAAITGSTISGNTVRDVGGGIACGTATITGSTIRGNTASIRGGGVDCRTGTILRSTISGNHTTGADGKGGGVYIFAHGSSTIIASTISGNTANKGGGVYLYFNIDAVPVAFRNSTISGNQATTGNAATKFGGGIYSYFCDAILQNCTIALNQAGQRGGGIASQNSTITLSSTIVALNSAAANVDLDSGTTIFEVDHSLIGDQTVAGINFMDNGDNVLGNTGSEKDPLLAPLAFNGGQTQTHKLKKGSPAINTGSNPDGLTTDQRGVGFKRKLGLAVDIGAFERQ